MRLTINYLKISKFFFLLFLVLIEIFRSTVFAASSASTMMSYVVLDIALIFDLMDGKKVPIDRCLAGLLLFAVFELLSSGIVSVDFHKSAVYLFVFAEYLVAFYLIQSYSAKDNSVNFVAKAFVFLAIAMAIVAITNGTGTNRLSISEDTNVNTVGINMMMGIAYLLFLFIEKEKTTKTITVNVAILLLLFYTLVLTVSKKAMIGAIAIILYWLICCYRNAFSNRNVIIRIVIFISLIVLGYYAVQMFISQNADTVEYIIFRFNGLIDSNDAFSTKMRSNLIAEGFDIFRNNPVLGVGFNNYRYYSSIASYSHCFYIESLACTGLIGFVLFLSPMIGVFGKMLRNRRIMKYTNGSEVNKTKNNFVIFLFVLYLYISWTIIIFYEFEMMYILAFFNAFTAQIYNKVSKE